MTPNEMRKKADEIEAEGGPNALDRANALRDRANEMEYEGYEADRKAGKLNRKGGMIGYKQGGKPKKMKGGGSVRGYGMARGGRACKMV